MDQYGIHKLIIEKYPPHEVKVIAGSEDTFSDPQDLFTLLQAIAEDKSQFNRLSLHTSTQALILVKEKSTEK